MNRNYFLAIGIIITLVFAAACVSPHSTTTHTVMSQPTCTHINQTNGSILIQCDQPNVTIVYNNEIYHSDSNSLMVPMMYYWMFMSSPGYSQVNIYNGGRYVGTTSDEKIVAPEEVNPAEEQYVVNPEEKAIPAEEQVVAPESVPVENENIVSEPVEEQPISEEGAGVSEEGGDSGGFSSGDD